MKSSSGPSASKVHAGLSPGRRCRAKLDAVKLVKEGPPEGKEHRCLEMYYESVLKGSRLVADECARDVIFE